MLSPGGLLFLPYTASAVQRDEAKRNRAEQVCSESIRRVVMTALRTGLADFLRFHDANLMNGHKWLTDV